MFFAKQKHLLDGNLAGHLAGRVFTTPRPGLVQPVEPRFVSSIRKWLKKRIVKRVGIESEKLWDVWLKYCCKYWRELSRRKSYPPGQIQLDRFPEGDQYSDVFKVTIVVPWRWPIFRISIFFSSILRYNCSSLKVTTINTFPFQDTIVDFFGHWHMN